MEPPTLLYSNLAKIVDVVCIVTNQTHTSWPIWGPKVWMLFDINIVRCITFPQTHMKRAIAVKYWCTGSNKYRLAGTNHSGYSTILLADKFVCNKIHFKNIFTDI